ncbi:MAG: 50S ribosomal protein L22 [Candidatus Taylorbacteria bacterium RIFCSPLOWO2_12_FULL_43_20]|uniref:Large ribosomal subunit protein uL22 n=1 Tax=Candidatus Taylorbacteria bacterium RIFCSPLOWO2_12_FULL_43_20 TaxID=1802332 RepID=A0A1G2P2H4_9BACT|nr:MAG: 50S ribosomal protein L22 [Candidatus Taylorbacteria bacterium RIFCSPHIGHO2_01_FULL_43_120]OHA23450.1 MAG: 50S ribosomal protein L22 [Candidatus Taylorbacteria bacterium RIFCSPHIGHO2_02_FULL_43_55]OHA29655.1 MAG: 50S ribosomal protein L22 [Candidatus Taylorbacteria bacterium RIFCSPHIGHO2_12_FULL_42_34]OHA31583.1 MAG: 50S ribosomal protein L22 [Candidatus Taylorbacteria bacterium RIFCSPLOWO2_01_FULL_43_83]OHA38964.1 MAG: 50S ribosomal protein L22 [Candidatus Taylorbacteria bacterium RIFC
MKANLNDYRQSPRKVRLVTRSLQGKKVHTALGMLDLLDKRAAWPLAKLIRSAVANAKNDMGKDESDLFIEKFEVNPGQVLKRRMPRARGSAFPIKKRTCHVSLVLGTKPENS